MTTQVNLAQAVKLLEQTKIELADKIERARRDLAAIERSVELLKEAAEGELLESALSDSHRLLGRNPPKPQAVVERFFRESPAKPFKPSMVAKLLKASGYQPKNPNPNVFVSQVRTSCLRLTDKGVLEQTKLDGKTAFQIKEPMEHQ